MHVNSNVKTVLTTLKEITAYYQMTSFVFKDFPFHAIQLESNKEEDKILSWELLSTDLLFHVHVHSWDIDICRRRDFVSNITMQISQLE